MLMPLSRKRKCSFLGFFLEETAQPAVHNAFARRNTSKRTKRSPCCILYSLYRSKCKTRCKTNKEASSAEYGFQQRKRRLSHDVPLRKSIPAWDPLQTLHRIRPDCFCVVFVCGLEGEYAWFPFPFILHLPFASCPQYPCSRFLWFSWGF